MWRYKIVKRTTLIALGCAAFLAGLGLAYAGVQVGWWSIPCVLIVLVCVLKKRLLFAVPAVIIAGLLLGDLRGTFAARELRGYQDYFETTVAVTGTLVDDPVYDTRGQRDFRLQNIELDGHMFPGQVRIKTFAFAYLTRGDTVQVTGKLRNGFGNYQAAMYFADVTLLAENSNPLDTIRRQFAASVLSALPEPQASLGLGFVLGYKAGLPDTLSEEFKILGLTHIVVASGFNLTILVRMVRRLCGKRSRYQTLLFASLLLVGFVGMAGLSPSLSRAALVTSLALAAWYFGRRIHPALLLLGAAAITAGLNPLFLWGDIGWWLSFLAFAGVLLLAPLIQQRFFGETKPPFLMQIIIETIAAQLLATPLILWIFGDFSALALFANLLVVPLIPLVMVLVAAVGLTSFVLPTLASLLAAPATWLLTYITDITHLLAAIPWAQTSLPIHLLVMLSVYACIAAVGYSMWRRSNYNYLRASVIE